MSRYFISLLLLTAFCSCIRIGGQLKGLYSYFEQTNKTYPGLLVHPPEDVSLCSIVRTDTPKIIIANGKQIRGCMMKSNHAVFYFWQPLCSSKFCYAVDVVQRECRKKNIDLYIVAEYYDGNKMQQHYALDRPIFAIDTHYYHSSFCDTYVPRFMKDLTGEAVRNIKFADFRNGTFQRTFERLEEL